MEFSLLPVDLVRWDQAPGGDLFVVPIWTDVRPLRGAAGLLDWRLNGRLSACLRDERFAGSPEEKLLLPTQRIPWRAILAVGLGPARGFADDRFLKALAVAFETMRGLGLRTLAVQLPGRDTGEVTPERAIALLRKAADGHEHVRVLTLVDDSGALKVMNELLGLTPAARPRAPPVKTRPR